MVESLPDTTWKGTGWRQKHTEVRGRHSVLVVASVAPMELQGGGGFGVNGGRCHLDLLYNRPDRLYQHLTLRSQHRSR